MKVDTFSLIPPAYFYKNRLKNEIYIPATNLTKALDDITLKKNKFPKEAQDLCHIWLQLYIFREL